MSNTATFPTETPKISTSIRKIKKNFYFRTRVAGKEKLIRLTATTEKNADLEAAKYKALVAANSIDELAAMVAAVKKITLPHSPDSPSPFRDIRLQPEISKSQKNFTESELLSIFEAQGNCKNLAQLKSIFFTSMSS